MSETSTLILYSGKITRTELATLPTPAVNHDAHADSSSPGCGYNAQPLPDYRCSRGIRCIE